MLISRTGAGPSQPQTIKPSATAPNEPEQSTDEPQWLDGMVDKVSVGRNLLISSTVATAAGTGLGAYCHQLPLGAALGAAAGLVGGVLYNAHLQRERAHWKQEILDLQKYRKNEFRQELDLPAEPTTSFDKAKVYANGNNFLLEFPTDGTLLAVRNAGPKRAQEWVSSESQAYGRGGEALGRLNQGIEETEVNISRAGVYEISRPNLEEVNRFHPLTPKDLQVELGPEGQLRFSHSGSPEGGATYDLNTGDVKSPMLEIENGHVKKLQFPEKQGESPYTGYRYERGVFKQLGGSDRYLRPAVPLSALGIDTVTFPSVPAPHSQTETKFSVHNDGVFQSASKTETNTVNYLPAGAEWAPEPKTRHESTQSEVNFRGGGHLESSLGYAYGANSADTQQYTTAKIDGVPRPDLSVSVNPESVTLKEKSQAFPRPTDKQHTETISKDGTITWRQAWSEYWTEYTFQPDGTVSGQSGLALGQREGSRLPESSLPTLGQDGTVSFNGFQEQLFVSPDQIGWHQ